MAEELSDGVLLARDWRDASAFDAPVTRYDGLLRHVATTRRLGEDAGDAVQAAWLGLLLHGHTLREPETLRGRLVVTVRHECLWVLPASRLVAPVATVKATCERRNDG